MGIIDLPRDRRECDICGINWNEVNAQSGDAYMPVSIPCPARHVFCVGCIIQWFSTVTADHFNNTCPICRAVVYEPEPALLTPDPDSEEEQGNVRVPPNSPEAVAADNPSGSAYNPQMDYLRGVLAHNFEPVRISEESVDRGTDWLFDLWSESRRAPMEWVPDDDDLEEMFELIQLALRRRPAGNLPPVFLYDALLAATLRQAAIRENGVWLRLRHFIRNVVLYLQDRGLREA